MVHIFEKPELFLDGFACVDDGSQSRPCGLTRLVCLDGNPSILPILGALLAFEYRLPALGGLGAEKLRLGAMYIFSLGKASVLLNGDNSMTASVSPYDETLLIRGSGLFVV